MKKLRENIEVEYQDHIEALFSEIQALGPIKPVDFSNKIELEKHIEHLEIIQQKIKKLEHVSSIIRKGITQG
jgi:hypothetical protein